MRAETTRNFRALRAAVTVAILAALMRALVPAGYMAAFDERGLTLVPCTGLISYEVKATGGGAHAHHAGHAGMTSGDGEDEDGDAPASAEHVAPCPFAASSNSVLASLVEAPAPAAVLRDHVAARLRATVIEIVAASFAPRGPPAFPQR